MLWSASSLGAPGSRKASGGGPSRTGWPARDLKRPGVTMTILWEEYREVHPEGYGYSRFAICFVASNGG